MAKFVFAADLHLKYQNWSRRPDIIGDAYCAWEQIVDYCEQKNENLVLGGDIFDTPNPEARDVTILRKGLNRLQTKNIKVFVIQGQHDRATPPWPEAIIGDSIHYVNDSVFQPVEGITAYALDNMSREALQTKLSEAPTADICILHQLAKPAFNLEDSWDFDPEWINTSVKMLLLGDLHKPIKFSSSNGISGYYSGSIHATELPVAKNGNLSFIEVDADTLQIQRIPLISRPFWFYTINTQEQLDQYSGEIHQKLSNVVMDAEIKTEYQHVIRPVIVIEYLTEVSDVETKIKAAIQDRAGFWPKPVTTRLLSSMKFSWGDDSAAVQDDTPPVETGLQQLAASDESKAIVKDLLLRPSKEVFKDLRTSIGLVNT